MKSPRYARLIAEVFKRGESRTSDVLLARSNRDEEIALIERAMDDKRRKSGRLRMAAKWSLAAVLVLGGAGIWRTVVDNASPRSSAARSALSTDAPGIAPPVAIAIASGGGAIVATPGSSTPAVAGRTLQAEIGRAHV